MTTLTFIPPEPNTIAVVVYVQVATHKHATVLKLFIIYRFSFFTTLVRTKPRATRVQCPSFYQLLYSRTVRCPYVVLNGRRLFWHKDNSAYVTAIKNQRTVSIHVKVLIDRTAWFGHSVLAFVRLKPKKYQSFSM